MNIKCTESELFAAKLLKEKIYAGIPLTFEEAYEVGSRTVEACRTDCRDLVFHTFVVLSASNNPAMLNHPDAPAMIAGIASAVLTEDIGKSTLGFVRPDVKAIFENCGMGGDTVVTANVSCLAALTASAAGVTMCKHGSPSNSDQGRCGSTDFLEAAGIAVMPSKPSLEDCVRDLRFGYIEALDTRYKSIHLETHRHIKLPHMNHLLGPMTSPVDPQLLQYRVMGINAHIDPRTVAKTFALMNDRGITNVKHAYFVRGYGDEQRTRCMDEVSICPGGTRVVELRDGNIEAFDLSAEAFGIEPVPPEAIGPPSTMSKKNFSLGILRGDIRGPAVQMVCANAAMLLRLANPDMSFKDAYREALRVFQTGGTKRMADAVRKHFQQQP